MVQSAMRGRGGATLTPALHPLTSCVFHYKHTYRSASKDARYLEPSSPQSGGQVNQASPIGIVPLTTIGRVELKV